MSRTEHRFRHGTTARSLAGLGAVVAGALVLSTCGTRTLTDAVPQSARIVTACAAPGRARVRCDGSQADHASRLSADLLTAEPSDTTAPPTTSTVAPTPSTAAPTSTEAPTTLAPTTVPETAAPAPAPEPEAAPADEEPAPDETAPPTTRKPKKPAPATTPAPAVTEPPAPAADPPADTAAPPPAADVRVDTSVAGRVTALVNAQRTAAGLAPVAINGALSSAAARHSKDQAATHTMTHAGSDGSTMAQRCSAAGYGWRGLAENVAAGQGSADSVMSAWMGSAPHRANILNASYAHIGVAVAYAADGTPYWTMDLGAPA